jgi:hypothetical protein
MDNGVQRLGIHLYSVAVAWRSADADLSEAAAATLVRLLLSPVRCCRLLLEVLTDRIRASAVKE